MVLSTSKKVASVASIVNQASGGGSKKAGLPHQVGRESNTSVAFRSTSQTLAVLKIPQGYNGVKQSRPIGISPMVWN